MKPLINSLTRILRPGNRYVMVLLAVLFLSCASNKNTSSVLYSDNYDKNKDETSLMIFPYGQVTIPGKWRQTRYSPISGQYFFSRGDATQFAVALQPWDQYEFSQDNPEVNRENFVRKFYEWDGSYLKEVTKGQLRIIDENKEKNYLLWSLKKGDGSNDYFLYGLKGNVAYNLYLSSQTWDEQTIVPFLENAFNRQ